MRRFLASFLRVRVCVCVCASTSVWRENVWGWVCARERGCLIPLRSHVHRSLKASEGLIILPVISIEIKLET